MAHERFPKREASHFGVWLIMQQSVERVFERFLFPATVVISIDVQRQTRDGFRQNSHAGIHRRHLHGGRFVHRFPARCTAKKEAVATAIQGILGFVAGVE
ncbi:hypothetical protein SDC9_147591 [bioreactor metagenome]|uniref:Uncharacterized protein n=1 Tax=bioreactor metagenome TaxID=1076179 RepID=A0A645EF44_9ZZZZ